MITLRTIKFALLFAVIHRLTAYALCWLGFVMGMTAFGGSSWRAISKTGIALLHVSTILDFPVALIFMTSYHASYGRYPYDGFFSSQTVSLALPAHLLMLWSLVVGLLLAVILKRPKHKT